jgi:hypothetical protein
MWRGGGGGAGDRSAATAGVPSAAITTAASAPLIVLLFDNLAPGSSRTKRQCHLHKESIFHAGPPGGRGLLEPYIQAVMRRQFRPTGCVSRTRVLGNRDSPAGDLAAFHGFPGKRRLAAKPKIAQNP